MSGAGPTKYPTRWKQSEYPFENVRETSTCGWRSASRAGCAGDVLRGAAVKPRQAVAERLGRGVGIEAEAAGDRVFHGAQHPGRGRVRVLVRVELDEPRDFRLLAGHVRVEPPHEGADE